MTTVKKNKKKRLHMIMQILSETNEKHPMQAYFNGPVEEMLRIKCTGNCEYGSIQENLKSRFDTSVSKPTLRGDMRFLVEEGFAVESLVEIEKKSGAPNKSFNSSNNGKKPRKQRSGKGYYISSKGEAWISKEFFKKSTKEIVDSTFVAVNVLSLIYGQENVAAGDFNEIQKEIVANFEDCGDDIEDKVDDLELIGYKYQNPLFKTEQKIEEEIQFEELDLYLRNISKFATQSEKSKQFIKLVRSRLFACDDYDEGAFILSYDDAIELIEEYFEEFEGDVCRGLIKDLIDTKYFTQTHNQIKMLEKAINNDGAAVYCAKYKMRIDKINERGGIELNSNAAVRIVDRYIVKPDKLVFSKDNYVIKGRCIKVDEDGRPYDMCRLKSIALDNLTYIRPSVEKVGKNLWKSDNNDQKEIRAILRLRRDQSDCYLRKLYMHLGGDSAARKIRISEDGSAIIYKGSISKSFIDWVIENEMIHVEKEVLNKLSEMGDVDIIRYADETLRMIIRIEGEGNGDLQSAYRAYALKKLKNDIEIKEKEKELGM